MIVFIKANKPNLNFVNYLGIRFLQTATTLMNYFSAHLKYAYVLVLSELFYNYNLLNDTLMILKISG